MNYYYVISPERVTESDIPINRNAFITRHSYSSDEMNSKLIASIDCQVIAWKLRYDITVDKFHFQHEQKTDVELTIHNAVIDGETVIGFVFHDQFFALTDVNRKQKPLYVPQDILDIKAYSLDITVRLISSGLTIRDGYIAHGNECVGAYLPLIGDVTLPEWIRSVEPYAFEKNTALVSICIPGNIKTVKHSAFKGCSSLETVVLCEGVEDVAFSCFCDCEKLSHIQSCSTVQFTGTPRYLPLSDQDIVAYADGVAYSEKQMIYYDTGCEDVQILPGTEKIEDSFFKNAANLKRVVIPEGVTHIADHAFENCTSLVHVLFPKSLIHIGTNAFLNCTSLEAVIIKGDLEDIQTAAFKNCSSLHTVELAGRSTTIGKEAFSDCTNIKRLRLHNGIAALGNDCFEKNTSLTEVVIPGSIRRIPYRAFLSCSSLTKVVIEEGVEAIDSEAFDNCVSLTDFRYPATLLSCDASALWDTPYYKNITDYVDGAFYIGQSIIKTDPECTEMRIRDNVKEIGVYGNCLFRKSTRLATLHLPDSMTEIEYGSLMGVHSLENVFLSKNIRTIGSYAFEDCTSLRTMVFPESLCYIEHCAFKNCTALETIFFKGTPFFISSNAFENCTSLREIIIESGNDDGLGLTLSGGAFVRCVNLAQVRLSENTREIQDGAFAYCPSLSSVYIPDPQTKIGPKAFYECNSDLVIECLPHSNAESFAKTNGLKVKYIS